MTGEYYCRLGQKAGVYYWGLLESTTVDCVRKLENTLWGLLESITGDYWGLESTTVDRERKLANTTGYS